MKFIIAILLAIPTYGVSLVVLICYMIYRTKNVKKNVEAAIRFFSENPSSVGSCVEGISYIQAYAYLSENGVLSKSGVNFFDYSVSIEGVPYAGTLGVEPGGSLAMFTSQDMSWVEPVVEWLDNNFNSNDLHHANRITSLRDIGLDGRSQQFNFEMEYIPEQLSNCKELEGIYLHDTKIIKIYIPDLQNNYVPF